VTIRWTCGGVGLLASLGVIAAGCSAAPPQKRSGARTPALQAAGIAAPAPQPSADVVTQHNDIFRTGNAANEAVLTTASVARTTFGKLYTRNVDGEIYAQPLFVQGVVMPGLGRRDVVYVATMTNHLYAFDANNADPDPDAGLLHQWQFGPPEPGAAGAGCKSALHYGIASTPVIDVNLTSGARTMYFVTKTLESGVLHQWLHALDLQALSERSVEISGLGNAQLGRAGLLLSGGRVYVAFGSHCDTAPYHGMVFAYDARTLAQVASLNTTPGGSGGGIWQSGNGLASDANGNVYFQVGNFVGPSTRARGASDLSESFVQVDTGLGLLHRYLPSDWRHLDAEDLDLGSSGPLVIPETGDVVGGGKSGRIYLLAAGTMQLSQTLKATLNLSNPGLSPEDCRYGSNTDSNGSPRSSTDLCPHIHSGLVYWRGPDPAFGRVYVWGERDYLRAYHYDLARRRFVDQASGAPLGDDGTGGAQRGPRALPLNDPDDGTRIMPAATLSISSHQNEAGTGIVWATHVVRKNGEYALVAGVLRAFDAATLRELWNSGIDPSDPEFLGVHAKYAAPTIAAGNVYVATGSGKLVVYGPRSRAAVRPNGKLIAMGKCLDPTNAGSTSGVPLQTWACNGGAWQSWQIRGGAIVGTSGRCLDVKDQVNANGARLQLWDCNGLAGQDWTFTDAAVRGLADKCLDVKDQVNANGAAIQSWECNSLQGQQWTLTEAGELRSNFGRCLDVKDQVNANGTRLQLWDCNGLAGQKWTVMPGGEIRSRLAPSRCLDVKDVNPNDGAPLQLWDCNGLPSQKWSLRGHIRSAFGRFLDVKDVNPANGAAIQIWDRVDLPSQLWEFYP
jgi:hypothetical protein